MLAEGKSGTGSRQLAGEKAVAVRRGPSRPATAWRPGVARVLIVRVRFIDFMLRRGRVRLPRIRRLSRTHAGVPLKSLRKAVKDKKLRVPDREPTLFPRKPVRPLRCGGGGRRRVG